MYLACSPKVEINNLFMRYYKYGGILNFFYMDICPYLSIFEQYTGIAINLQRRFFIALIAGGTILLLNRQL